MRLDIKDMGAKLLICITAFLAITLSSQLILWQPVYPFIATEEGGSVFPMAAYPFGVVKIAATDCGDKNWNGGWNTGSFFYETFSWSLRAVQCKTNGLN